MAAITVNSVKRSIFGDRRVQILNLTGVSTNTYAPGWDEIDKVTTSPGSAITATAVAGVPAVVTFTSSGAITNEIVEIIGR